MVLINEEIVGRKLDRDGITSNQHALKYGIVLIKYYRYLGMTNDEIKEILKDKIHIKNDISGTLTDYLYNTMVLNMNICGEFKNQPIGITSSELEFVEKLNDRKAEQFFFVFLVLCKSYRNRVKVAKNEVMRMARLPVNSKEFDKYFDKMLELGYMDIGVSKYKIKDVSRTAMYYCLTPQIAQCYKAEETVFEVHDTNDPIMFYWMYYDIMPIRVCEDCGTLYPKSKKAVRGRDLCKECRKKEQNEAAKLRMRRVRKRRRENNTV